MDAASFKFYYSPLLEQVRLRELKALDIMNSDAESSFDTIVDLAAAITQAPIAVISLLDESRQWFKARVGLDVPETPRSIAFCDHTIRSDEPMIIEDALEDPRFAQNPLVLSQPCIRFYGGFPLKLRTGSRPGALCVIGSQPRTLSQPQIVQLKLLAAITAELMQMRAATRRANALA